MKSLYPRYFKTPEGRPISIRSMRVALNIIRNDPLADYPGWNWFPTPGWMIIKEVRKGIHDRINRREINN